MEHREGDHHAPSGSLHHRSGHGRGHRDAHGRRSRGRGEQPGAGDLQPGPRVRARPRLRGRLVRAGPDGQRRRQPVTRHDRRADLRLPVHRPDRNRDEAGDRSAGGRGEERPDVERSAVPGDLSRRPGRRGRLAAAVARGPHRRHPGERRPPCAERRERERRCAGDGCSRERRQRHVQPQRVSPQRALLQPVALVDRPQLIDARPEPELHLVRVVPRVPRSERPADRDAGPQ